MNDLINFVKRIKEKKHGDHFSHLKLHIKNFLLIQKLDFKA